MAGALRQSKRLAEVLKTRVDAAYDCASATCTAGYDNDGSTGFEIFENGFHLGAAAGSRDVFYAVVSQRTDEGTQNVAFFVLGETEDEAVLEAQSWDED